jgi:glycosyltransferase involved in cell wall biosynthesis
VNDIKYSVVIPIYRSEKYISKLTEDIVSFFLKSSYAFEIIFVADTPIDNSWQTIQQLKLKYTNKITAVLLPKNIGQHAATIEGLKIATGNFIFTIDEDGQHNPNHFEQMIKQQQSLNADVMYGSYKKRSHSLLRNATSFFSKLIFKICIPNFYWHYTSYRLIKFETAKKIISTKINYPFIDGMIFLNTQKISSIIVHHSVDNTNKSSYSIYKLTKHFINIIFVYSFKKN